MNPELLKVLCCPMCHGVVVDNGRCLLCRSCAKEYPTLDGIPDMRVYESPACTSEFNREQALYEAGLHDEEAESDYEKRVIRTFGTKTTLMVRNWAIGIDRMSSPVVLDYGCGTGQVSRVLASHVRPLFAFDISEKSLQKNVSENCVLGVLANSLYLPFKERAFDIVCINGVLHHIVDLERAISEVARVTKLSVYVSEGIPRKRPSFGVARFYPRCHRKVAYSCYVAAYWYCALIGRGKRRVKRLLTKRADGSAKSLGSKYERPLDVHLVESIFQANGFRRSQLSYFTNIDIPGDGAIKNMLTQVLANDIVGTHFDLRMDRDFSTLMRSDSI